MTILTTLADPLLVLMVVAAFTLGLFSIRAIA